MNESEITVVLVNWYSGEFLQHLVPNLRAKAAHPERLRFLLLDNTNGQDEAIKALCASWDPIEYLPLDVQGLKGSWGHAFALKEGLERVQTEYFLTIDPDVHVFAESWDEALTARLKQTGAIAAGAAYPQWKLGKYHDFPSPVFALLHTASIQSLETDWTPFDEGQLRNVWNWAGRQIVRLFWLNTRKRCIAFPVLLRAGQFLERQFGIVGPDTGYRLARAARKRGQQAILFEDRYGTAPEIQGDDHVAQRELADLYELYVWQGRPFMTHMGSTRNYLHMTTASYDESRWLACIGAVEAVRREPCAS